MIAENCLKEPQALKVFPAFREGGEEWSNPIYINVYKVVLSATHTSSSLSPLLILALFLLQEEKKKESRTFFISAPASLLFPRQQRQKIVPKKKKKIPANSIGSCLGACIIGVSGASSQCLCIKNV